MDELQNQSGGGKSPEEELAALLRQAGARPAVKGSGIHLPNLTAPRSARPMPKINWLAVGIGVLTLVLVAGTGYVLLAGLKFNTGQITLELNEAQVAVKLDSKSMGTVDSGAVFTLKTGEHTVSFSKDGFLEVEKVITVVRKDKQLLSVQMLPIPSIEKLVEGRMQYVRLSKDGSEVSYYDQSSSTFKTVKVADKTTVSLFRGTFQNVLDVSWSPVTQAGIVKLSGQPKLGNVVDNRGVRGRYVVLGERPVQGKAKSTGSSTWLFDDALKESQGWQPVLLNESIRQTAFSADGGEILYIYDTADGEYSLVRALPNGEEWERLIVDFPKLGSGKLIWGADDRYALLEGDNKLFAIDLVSKDVSEILQDKVVGSVYAVSPDGLSLAYLADENGMPRLKTYSLASREATVLDKVSVDKGTVVTWLDVNDLLVVAPNQMFIKVNRLTQDKLNIPFVGQEINFQIQRMEYSVLGQTLMLDTPQGIFVMKI